MQRQRLILCGLIAASMTALTWGCSEENVTNPTVTLHDTLQQTFFETVFVAETSFVTDTVSLTDTLQITDTLTIVDTVAPPLEGDWLRYSAYLASVEFVKAAYPDRSNDRFSSLGEYCNYGSAPAGRAGFSFEAVGPDTYATGGYTFEWIFGAPGWVWGAAQNQPTENVYSWQCTLHYEGNGNWTASNVALQSAGPYIRDTRHD